MMFYMDTTKAPFNDNNVRLAIKLIADRQALIDGALNGYGSVGNDLVGKGLQWYDESTPAARAGHRAGQVAAAEGAGQENLTVLLQTSQIFPGFVESATLLAEQAKAAGVTMNLKQEPANSYYNPSLLYLKMPFAETQWAITSMKFFYLQALASNAPYNETHWKDTPFNDLLCQAIGETDDDQGPGPLEPGAADPVRPGRLPELDERRLGGRPLEQGQGHEAERRRRPRQHDVHGRVAGEVVGVRTLA